MTKGAEGASVDRSRVYLSVAVLACGAEYGAGNDDTEVKKKRKRQSRHRNDFNTTEPLPSASASKPDAEGALLAVATKALLDSMKPAEVSRADEERATKRANVQVLLSIVAGVGVDERVKSFANDKLLQLMATLEGNNAQPENDVLEDDASSVVRT